MYVCMYVCVYVCMYVCVYVLVYKWHQEGVCVCVCVCVWVTHKVSGPHEQIEPQQVVE